MESFPYGYGSVSNGSRGYHTRLVGDVPSNYVLGSGQVFALKGQGFCPAVRAIACSGFGLCPFKVFALGSGLAQDFNLAILQS